MHSQMQRLTHENQVLSVRVNSLIAEVQDSQSLCASMQQLADEAALQLSEANAARNELSLKCERLAQENSQLSSAVEQNREEINRIQSQQIGAIANNSEDQQRITVLTAEKQRLEQGSL